METQLPYAVDPRNNLAVKDCDNRLVCVADSKERTEFIVRACNACIQTQAEAQVQA